MIYLLEDDDSIRKLVIYALESQGFEAEGFAGPEGFWKAMDRDEPELILLDIMLPGEDGISILKKIRAAKIMVPVIMLTARNSEYDKVEGLDAGADDYITKPFGIMELIARVKAVLRRYVADNNDNAEEYAFGPLMVFPKKRLVLVDGEEIGLTYKEFTLLMFLIEHQDVVLTRDILMDRIWGIEAVRENRTLDVHIRTLRAKLGEAGNYIQTVRGVGYRFSADQ